MAGSNYLCPGFKRARQPDQIAKIVGCAYGQHTQGNRGANPRQDHAVHYLTHCAIATGGNYNVVTIGYGRQRQFGTMSLPFRDGDVR
jgi:hypothetical protein